MTSLLVREATATMSVSCAEADQVRRALARLTHAALGVVCAPGWLAGTELCAASFSKTQGSELAWIFSTVNLCIWMQRVGSMSMLSVRREQRKNPVTGLISGCLREDSEGFLLTLSI